MSCDECTFLKDELDTYKNLYRKTLEDLVNVKNLLYYMRLGDLHCLLEVRATQEKSRKDFLSYKKVNNIPLEPHQEQLLQVPQAEIPPFSFD